MGDHVIDICPYMALCGPNSLIHRITNSLTYGTHARIRGTLRAMNAIAFKSQASRFSRFCVLPRALHGTGSGLKLFVRPVGNARHSAQTRREGEAANPPEWCASLDCLIMVLVSRRTKNQVGAFKLTDEPYRCSVLANGPGLVHV